MEKTPEYIEFLKTRISPSVKPEVAELMIEYALTPEEHKKALENVRQYCFSGMSPVKNPKIYLVIAQTGGGKSSLTASILKNEPNTVVIDSDAFKAFNPKRQEISKNYPTLYGYLTGIDAYIHRDEIYAEALQKGYNVLVEIAPSSKERLFTVNFDELEYYGYQIEANVLAVSLANSLLSVHERFEGQIEAKMAAPKLTDFKRAVDSYNAVELVLSDLTKMNNVNVNIWKRGNDAVNTNIKNEFNSKNLYPNPLLLTCDKNQAIQVFGAARKLDEEITKNTAEKRIETIKSQMKLRNAPTDQRAQFSKVEEQICSEMSFDWLSHKGENPE